jgi:hypothetical protein
LAQAARLGGKFAIAFCSMAKWSRPLPSYLIQCLTRRLLDFYPGPAEGSIEASLNLF